MRRRNKTVRPKSVPEPGPFGLGLLLLAATTVVYTYAGYPVLIEMAARRRRRNTPSPGPVPSARPAITVVIPALDESKVIARKIRNTRELDYPAEVEIIVVADGSTDDTVAIARDLGVHVIFEPERRGKAAAVNRAIVAAEGEVVVLTDANCLLDATSLRAVSAGFDDPHVAIVSGAKTVTGQGTRGGGEGLYWRLEGRLKAAESTFGATMGSPGELTAIRRSMFRPIPAGIINDDFHLTCDALMRRLLVRYSPAAVAREEVSLRNRDELERRTRIAAGTWQTTLAHLALLDPRRGWTAVAFLSHRLLRSIVAPVLLAPLWVGSVVLARTSRVARTMALVQSLIYAAAILGSAMDTPVLSAPFQFGLTNLAALRGATRYLTGRQPVGWTRVARSETPSPDRP